MNTMEILKAAKANCPTAALLSADVKNAALNAMADMLEARADDILSANAEDVAAARGHISEVMLDRLTLTKARIAGMAKGLRDVAALPDPVGRVLSQTTLYNGLSLTKISVPLGVVAIIFESRPNVAADAAALAIKSGNVCVLRGGKEAFKSVSAIVRAMREGLKREGLPEALINQVEDISRDSARELMTAVGLVDLLIPRGGAGLINACLESAKVPCIETGTGICHIYVDGSADIDMALEIIDNAKVSRPSVCNACEVCLVAEDIADSFLPLLKKRLTQRDDGVCVELRLDKRAAEIIDGTPAGNADFDTEFLDHILAVGVVKDVRAAVAHIESHSTRHSDAIITRDMKAAEYFVNAVDSAAVYVNASTRFTDGGEFGLGCEMGISTQKLHARGPMGLSELTSYKYVVRGDGQIR